MKQLNVQSFQDIFLKCNKRKANVNSSIVLLLKIDSHIYIGLCVCKDKTSTLIYCGLKYLTQKNYSFHIAEFYFLYSNTSYFLCWKRKIFPSVKRVGNIGFGKHIENLKVAVNNREHCKEPP
jgi:hypothetical protein